MVSKHMLLEEAMGIALMTLLKRLKKHDCFEVRPVWAFLQKKKLKNIEVLDPHPTKGFSAALAILELELPPVSASPIAGIEGVCCCCLFGF